MEIGREGLRVRQTDATRDVLARAAAASTDDDAFSSYAEASTVPFRILRRACEIARRDAPVERLEGSFDGLLGRTQTDICFLLEHKSKAR